MIGWLCEHTDPCLKVSIIPRTNGALGFTQSLPKELAMYTECELQELLMEIMGGRASEKVCIGDVTTGSSDDLKKGTQIAEQMVANYGFSDRIGLVSYQNGNSDDSCMISQETVKIIEEEKKRLLGTAFDNAVAMLTKNKNYVEQLAQLLLEKETITSVDLEKIMGKRKGINPVGYSDLINEVEKQSS